MSRRASRPGGAGRTSQPTVKQMQSVPCPACKALPGEPCTIQGGHRARAEALTIIKADGRTVVKTDPGQKPKNTGGQRRATSKTCAICRKPLGKRPTAKAKSGKTCHASCLTRAQQAGNGNAQPSAPRQWNTAAAEREFARNKEAVEAGRTYRGHKPSGWRLGGSPSTAGESRR